MTNRKKLLHIKSSVSGNTPSQEQLTYGEIAVNYNVDTPALYIKDSANNIVEFGVTSEQFSQLAQATIQAIEGVSARVDTVSGTVEDNSLVVSAALNYLNTNKLDVSAYTPTDLSDYYNKQETNEAITQATSGKADISSLTAYATTMEYIGGSTQKIYLKNGNNVLSEISASDFIKDGMVDTVSVTSITSGSVEVEVLQITFNTDSGKQAINIPLSDLFDSSQYYTKEDIDESALVVATALNDLASSARTLDDEIQEIYSTVSANTYAISALEVGVETSASTLYNNFNSLSGTVNELSSDIASLSGTVSGLSSGFTSLSGTVNELSSGFTSLSGYVASNLYTLRDIVSTLSGTVGNLSGSVNTINENIASLSAAILDDEYVIATAINDLEMKKLDISAYTPSSETMLEVTYSALVALVSQSGLTKGSFYRITDYETTTTQENTSAASHVFDVIVQALDDHTLSENAQAIQHSGDTYFSGCKLEAWEIKYCLNNDTNRFIWADATNGKGVIYYMKDEWSNECSYDFKNILFKRWKISDSMSRVINDTYTSPYSSSTYQNITIPSTSDIIWAYTFSNSSAGGTQTDNSLNVNGAFSNKISKKGHNNSCYKLNNNVFYGYAAHNILLGGCSDNSFCEGFSGNFIGAYAEGNIIGSQSGENTIGSDFNRNTIGSNFIRNIIGNYVHLNSIGNGFSDNEIGNVGNCTFASNCSGNKLFSCTYITFVKDCTQNVTVENNNQNISLTSTQTTSLNNVLRNITIAKGTNTTSNNKTISHNTLNDTFHTTYQNASSTTVNA